MSCSAALEALSLPEAIGSWRSVTDEWMCACGQTASLSSACFSFLFYRTVVSLSQAPFPLQCIVLPLWFALSPASLALAFSCSSENPVVRLSARALCLPSPHLLFLHCPCPLLFLYKGVLIVVMAVGESTLVLFTRKCQSVEGCVQVSARVCVALRAPRHLRAAVMSVFGVCSVLLVGQALWPQSLGDQEVEVWGWMVSSITSLSYTTTVTVDREEKDS